MDFLEKNKGILAMAIIVILAIFLYNIVSGGAAAPAAAAPAESVGADLLKVADDLSKATLSRGLFSVSGYRVLSDFSAPLEQEPLGRPNPFAPLGQ